MKAAMIVLLVIVIASLINFVRTGAGGVPLPQVVPGLGGPTPALYLVAGGMMILLAMMGWKRLSHAGEDTDEDEEIEEEDEEDEEEYEEDEETGEGENDADENEEE